MIASPGEHNIEVSYFTYKTLKIKGINVLSGETYLTGSLKLVSEDNLKLDEVVIVAEVSKNTETALLTLKKKATRIIDGISSAKISQIGDGTAVEAAKSRNQIKGESLEFETEYCFVFQLFS